MGSANEHFPHQLPGNTKHFVEINEMLRRQTSFDAREDTKRSTLNRYASLKNNWLAEPHTLSQKE
jgi:hypothetical protein